MPAYYPVFLDLKGRRCVVIGGGHMGEEKATRLLDSGADVTVVSPTVTGPVADMARDGGLEWVRRRYAPGDLDGAFIAIVADTTDPDVNRSVSEEAEARNVPLNVVDVTALCTWIAPAIVRRGEVTVAISTGGASPALARKLREELSGAARLPSRHGAMEFADLAPLLSRARGELARRGVKVSPDHWQACLTDDLVDLVQEGRLRVAEDLLKASLLEGVDCGCEDGVCKMWEEKAAMEMGRTGSPST